jgi:tetratricopeptide (TPR) repeat protein
MRPFTFLGLAAIACFFFAPPRPIFSQKAEPKKPDPIKAALAKPRLLALHGNYEEAREAYLAVGKKDNTLAPHVVLGIAESYRVEGNFKLAREELDDANKAYPDHPDILAARANLLYETGRWDEAEKDADAAIAKKEGQLLARWTKARILRDRGNTDEADKEFRWVVRYYTKRSNDDDDIEDPEELLMVAHCGAENARWHNLSKQFSFILNEVLKDTLKIDKEFWPAEQLAGELLLEKYNRPDAQDAFDKALKINPKAVEPLVGKAHAALVKYDLKEAESLVEQGLKKNPKHPGALRVKAELQMMASDYAGAEKSLKGAKEVNPRDERTLGRLAAALYVQNKKADYDAIVKEVSEFDTKPGLFYYELGEALDERKRYAEAEAHYKKAAELRPMLAGPRTSLGMLYLRMGNEAEGRKLLDAAFKLDPFNVKVANTRKVLAHLDGYRVVQTEHYELKYDIGTDKILGEFIADYLEQTHAELKKQYGFEPQGKSLFEVFNSHEMFSGRTVGLPDLHTVGACTGRVVAIASPKAKGLAKPFNWGRVIRHELTHVFNLAQTDFQCPHWLTEGLATRNENMQAAPEWNAILKERHAAGTLFNLDTVMMGFVRPKNQDEWTLAYYQSLLYVKYAAKAHGEPCLAKILGAYKQGLDTTAAIRAGCDVEKAEFEKGYRKFVDDIVKSIPGTANKKPEKELTYEELKDAVKESPDDLDLKARLAEQYVRRRENLDEAKKLIDEVWEKKPGHPTAALLRARFLADDGDNTAAISALERGLKDAPDDLRLKAAVLRLYRKTNANDKLAPYLEEIVAYDPDDLDSRLRLAKLRTDAGKHAEAEYFARDALFIDVMNVEARKLLLDALRAQGKEAEAVKIEKRYGE